MNLFKSVIYFLRRMPSYFGALWKKVIIDCSSFQKSHRSNWISYLLSSLPRLRRSLIISYKLWDSHRTDIMCFIASSSLILFQTAHYVLHVSVNKAVILFRSLFEILIASAWIDSTALSAVASLSSRLVLFQWYDVPFAIIEIFSIRFPNISIDSSATN